MNSTQESGICGHLTTVSCLYVCLLCYWGGAGRLMLLLMNSLCTLFRCQYIRYSSPATGTAHLANAINRGNNAKSRIVPSPQAVHGRHPAARNAVVVFFPRASFPNLFRLWIFEWQLSDVFAHNPGREWSFFSFTPTHQHLRCQKAVRWTADQLTVLLDCYSFIFLIWFVATSLPMGLKKNGFHMK